MVYTTRSPNKMSLAFGLSPQALENCPAGSRPVRTAPLPFARIPSKRTTPRSGIIGIIVMHCNCIAPLLKAANQGRIKAQSSQKPQQSRLIVPNQGKR